MARTRRPVRRRSRAHRSAHPQRRTRRVLTETSLSALAIVGWEDGTAGQIDSWIGACGQEVLAFVHPEDEPPKIDVAAATNRPARRFDFPKDGTFKGRPLLCARDWPALLRRRGIGMAIVTISDKARRVEEIARAREAGLEIPSAVHPSVVVLPDAILGASLVVHARAVIGYRAELGDGVIVGIGVQLDHHNVVKEGVTLDPGAVTAGNVLIERCAHVHTGASIINRITIGAEAVVAAGAVVINDVAPRTLVAGVPAVEKKRW